jgi:hypothetical protein
VTVDQIVDQLSRLTSIWWRSFDSWHDNLLLEVSTWPSFIALMCADYVLARVVLGTFLLLLHWFWRRLLAIPLLLQRMAAETGDTRHLRFSVLYAIRTTGLPLGRAPTFTDRLNWTVFYDEHFGLFGWKNASTTIGRWALGQVSVGIQNLSAGFATNLGRTAAFFVRPVWKAAVGWLLTALIAAPPGSLSALLPRIAAWTRSLPLSTFGTATSIATVVAIVLTVTRLMDVRGRAEFAKHAAFTSRVALAALHEPVGSLRESITGLVDHVSRARTQPAGPMQEIAAQAQVNLLECQGIVRDHIVKAGLRSEFLRITPRAARPLALLLLDDDLEHRLREISDALRMELRKNAPHPEQDIPVVTVPARGTVRFSGRPRIVRSGSPTADAVTALRFLVPIEVASVEFQRALDEELNPNLLYRLASSIGK